MTDNQHNLELTLHAMGLEGAIVIDPAHKPTGMNITINFNENARALVVDQEEQLIVRSWTPPVVKELVEIAATQIQTHAQARFFGIGASPAYLLYAMDRLSQGSAEVKYVPFSGRPFKQQEAGEDLQPDLSGSYGDFQKNKYVYRDFLSDMGLHPSHIIQKFDQGQPTRIYDNIQKGGSFGSFVFLMHEWARELHVETKLGSALQCVALIDDLMVAQRRRLPRAVKRNISAISIPSENFKVSFERIDISTALRGALNANTSKESDRFVPSYPPELWAQKPEDVEQRNALVVGVVKARIEEAVREARRPVRAERHSTPENKP